MSRPKDVAGLGRRGGGGDEHRPGSVGAVVGADPAQPAHQVGHVGSEDAAVAVGLVHDHVAQPAEEPCPPGVVGQDPEVQHVRVGQDEVRVVADPAAGRRVGVAVVGLCPDGGKLQRPDGGQLVGGQGLGGGKVQGDGAVVVDLARVGEDPQFGPVDRIQRRQLVGQRFAGGSAGGDHHVLAGMGEVGGLDLVPVGLVDAERAVGVHHVGVDPLGPRRVHGLAGGDGAHMAELFRVRAAAQQRNQGLMRVHSAILSPGLKSAGARDLQLRLQPTDRSAPSSEADSIRTWQTGVQPRCEYSC